jgi:2-amino-4-hydroxy-6-hydroxymethyldihydropteridine diphosphokinase
MELLLALGSNLGDRAATLRMAARALQQHATLVQGSPLYETEPMYRTDQPPFLNAVLRMRARPDDTDPLVWLQRLLAIEADHGRARTVPNAPRPLDLDLLAIDDIQTELPTLTLPHPRMWERPFVLWPLADCHPDWVHPTFRTSARDRARELPRPPLFLPPGWWT